MGGKGYELRDYKEAPEFSGFNEYSGDRLPTSQWKQRIDYMNTIMAMPYHFHKSFCKIQNQRRTSLCWMYGTVAGVANRLASQGAGFVDLNAYAVGYKYKGTDRKGGFGLEAAKAINVFGIPEKDEIPEFKKTRDWPDRVKKSAKRYKIVDFEEIGKNDLHGAINAILHGYPTTFAIESWRHLVLGVGVVYQANEYGVVYANSWGTRYSSGGIGDGYGILWGKKATPYESIVIKHAGAVSES